jgi:predicted phosphate transport protein (TIGR00153 family)
MSRGKLIFMDRSYDWFVQRHRTRGLELAHEEITSAFDTVTWLHKATKSFSEKNLVEAKKYIENLYKTEENVDQLRTKVFMELSTGAALVADYREDLLHLVKRADTLADDTKDAARCLEMLSEADIPKELCDKIVLMSGELVNMVNILRSSVEKISSNPKEAINEAKKVSEIENTIDDEYLKTKSLFVKYGSGMNCGAMVIFDDLIEFLEQAADMCADTADYINVLANRE